MMDINGIASMVYRLFDKNTSNTNKGTGINSNAVYENNCPWEIAMPKLAKELHKPFITKRRFSVYLVISNIN